jgi:predicted dehydrogenase
LSKLENDKPFLPYPASIADRNLEAFARAVRGDAPYPIAGSEIVATSAVMEAIFRSSETGKVEPVPD